MFVIQIHRDADVAFAAWARNIRDRNARKQRHHLSGDLSRSDLVLWPFCDMRIELNVRFAPRPAVPGLDSEFDNVQRTGLVIRLN